jgi:hypothetical protein
MRLTRKPTRTVLSLLLALLLGWWSMALAQPAQQSVLVEAVEAVGITVADTAWGRVCGADRISDAQGQTSAGRRTQ